MTDPIQRPEPNLPPAFVLTLWVLLAVALLLIWIPPYPPLTDYPEHLLAIQVLAHYQDSSFNYVRDYSIHLRNVPYIAVYLTGMILNKVFSIYVVGKILLSLYILFTPLSILAYVRSFPGASPWPALLSFILLFNFFYYLGSINFLLSIPLAFFTLALLLRLLNMSFSPALERDSVAVRKRRILLLVGLAFASTALLYAHIVSYAAVMLAALALLLRARLEKRPWIFGFASLIPAGLLGLFSIYEQQGLAKSEFAMSWMPLRDRMFDLLQPFLIYRDDYFHRLVVHPLNVPLLALLSLLFMLALVALIGHFLRGSTGGISEKAALGADAWVVFGSFLLAALCFPTQIPSASVAHRLSIFVVMSSYAVIPALITRRRIFRSLVIAAVVYSFSLTAWSAVQFNREMKPFLRLVEQMAPGATVLPLVQNLHVSGLKTYAFLHIMNYYHLEKGGANPYLFFRNMPQIPVHYRFLEDLPSVGSFEPDLFDWNKHHGNYRYFVAREPHPPVLDQLYGHTQLRFASKGWYLFESWR
jgi:hypothetical protein